MKNRIYDGVLINLLQKGPTTGTIPDIARQFMEPGSVSARYKKSVRDFSIEDFSSDDTLLPREDEHHRLFFWHYRPRVYRVFGFFDLAILQLCDSVEIISELSTQRSISATQNIFGLRTRTEGREGDLHGTLEICSPLLPYLFICNVKVHPLFQMLFGKDLQGLLNLHFARYLDEIDVLGRAAEPGSRDEIIALAVIDTFGWNEVTFLIHGSSFDQMSAFVWNRIRSLRLADLPAAEPSLFPRWSETLRARITGLAKHLAPYGLDETMLDSLLPSLPLFSHTETIPCLDYRLGQRLCQAPPLQGGGTGVPESFFATVRRDFEERVEKNSFLGSYLQRADPRTLGSALDRIVSDLREDRAGCLTGFSIVPGKDEAFHSLLSRVMDKPAADETNGEVVLGQYDAYLEQLQEPGTGGNLLARLQKILRIPQNFEPEQPEGSPEHPEKLFSKFRDLVISSKTAVKSPILLEKKPVSEDPFETLRQKLPRVFNFKSSAPDLAAQTLIRSCRLVQMPKPLQISLEHTLEPFYSFLQNPGLFSQYIDLYLPLLLITRQIERTAAGQLDDHRPLAEHVSRELRQFNHAFQARFQASHLNSESTEPTLEFKAHTVTPLDTIQCIIDCFTQTFVGFDVIAGFPLISVSNRPQIHISRVFSVELNSFHLLYPESLLVLFHEMGHLYLRYRGLSRSERAAGGGTCLSRMLKVDDEHTTPRWTAFTAGLPGVGPGQAVEVRHVVTQAEEILADLLLLTGVCRNDWTVFLWYVLTQIESMTEYFPEDAPPGDPQQIALYREILMRLFLVHAFRAFGSSDRPEAWASEVRFERVREFAGMLRRQSKKLRDFCARNDPDQLDYAAWKLIEAFARPETSFAPRSEARGIVRFQANRDFWFHGTADIQFHPGLPALFMSLIFESYRWMLEDIVSNWLLAYGPEDLSEIEARGDVDFERLRAGESPMAELEILLRDLIARDRFDPMEYLEKLRDHPSSGWAEPPLPADRTCWPLAYRRVTKALYALVRFFYAENNRASEEFRYLYRNPRNGHPEQFHHGRSDVEQSPCFQGGPPPLPIVIDRRGVFFCRSTEARQRAFQYRNAVIRELADLHSKLRPAKMAEIRTITEAYRKLLHSSTIEPL